MKVFEVCKIDAERKITRVGLFSSLDSLFSTKAGAMLKSDIELYCRFDGILAARQGEGIKDYITRCLDACPDHHVYFHHNPEPNELIELLGGKDAPYIIDFYAIEII